jgi:hypothetical protein
MQEDQRPFPGWPDGRDRVREVPFRYRRSARGLEAEGDYVNDAGTPGEQRFRLTATAPERGGERFREFCRRLRVWFEAVPPTPDARRVVRTLENDPLPEDVQAFEAGYVTFTLSIRPLLNPGSGFVYAVIDPDIDPVGRGERHVYERNRPGTALLNVTSGKAKLEGVSGGPFSVTAGHASPQKRAGTRCAVYGEGKATYYLQAIWDVA